MDVRPEVLLVNWPVCINVPVPDLVDLDHKYHNYSRTNNTSWVPKTTLRSLIISQIPIYDDSDSESLDIGENSYRQGSELSGYRWITVPW